MQFRFDPSKDLLLREIRGFGYDDIIRMIDTDGLIMIEPHPNKEKYPHQKMMYVQMPDGIYMIPCIDEGSNTFFLKTAYKSRVATKKFSS